MRLNALLALSLLLGAGGLRADPLLPSPVPPTSPDLVIPSSTYTWRTMPAPSFGPGEDLQFRVNWGMVTGGYSNLSIEKIDLIHGRPAFHIVSGARSVGLVDTFYKVRDRNESWLDVSALVTTRYERHISEGKYKIDETGEIHHASGTYRAQSYRIDKNRYEMKQGTVPVNVLDVLSSLYVVRTMPLEVGASYTLDVLSRGKIFPLIVTVTKREKVRVPAGKFDCFKVEPKLREAGIFVSKGRKLEVWITAGERRWPVKMRSEVKIGHVTAELISATASNAPQP